MLKDKPAPREVVVAVRHALVRRWIEVNSLQLQYSASGMLRIRGTLKLISGGARSVDGSFLSEVENDLRRIAGVKQLDLDFDNWSHADGTWSPR